MPKLQTNGASIHYEIHGSNPDTIVFAHGLLLSGNIFGEQVAVLKDHYRCITFDFRGQGQSEVTRSGYDMETLYSDTVGVIESLGASPCHFVGLSMGGIVGLRIAIRRPDLLKSLSLLATSADAETDEKKKRYRFLTFFGRMFGLRVVAADAMKILFGRTFLNDPSKSRQRKRLRTDFIANHRLGASRAVIGVASREPIFDQLNRITTPTLILMGNEDAAISMERARRIHSQIIESKLIALPHVGHTPTVEEPETVTGLLKDFFSKEQP